MVNNIWYMACLPQHREVAKAAKWKNLFDAVSHIPIRYENHANSVNGIPDGHPEKRQIIVTGRVNRTFKSEYKLRFTLYPETGNRIICNFPSFAEDKHDEFPHNEIITLAIKPVRANNHPDDEPAWICMYPTRIHDATIKPIYKGVTGANPALLEKAIQDHLKLLKEKLGSDLTPIVKAIIAIHEPESMETTEKARRFLANIEAHRIRDKYLKHQKHVEQHLIAKKEDIEKVIQSLPFPPTDEQDKAIRGIISNMEEGLQKNAISGDVSTGKTMTSAGIAGILIQSELRAGRKILPIVAMLAPTSLLAEQLADEYTNILPNLKIGLCLPGKPKPDHNCHILIGTTSVFSHFKPGQYPRLLIVDEEHRFGVEDRERLMGPETFTINMTATPIPRTAGLIMSGGIAVHRLTKTPKPRVVSTHLATNPKHKQIAFAKALQTLNEGGKVIVIYPSIESKKMASIHHNEKAWKDAWPNLGIIHSDTKNADEVLKAFRAGEIRLILASTKVEIGIDIPDTTMILVAEAERFGLATLHQLRGRVGRGGLPGKCILISANKKAHDRLQFFCSCNNGFDLSEFDMNRRGLGIIEGREQSGHRFKYIKVEEDKDLMELIAA